MLGKVPQDIKLEIDSGKLLDLAQEDARSAQAVIAAQSLQGEAIMEACSTHAPACTVPRDVYLATCTDIYDRVLNVSCACTSHPDWTSY